MYKKIISFVLVLSMVTIAALTSFAQNNESNFVNEEKNSNLINSTAELNALSGTELSDVDKEAILEDISVMEDCGLAGFELQEISIENGNAEYELKFGDIVSLVSVDESIDGTITFDIREGDKHDILTIAPDGNYYIDGSLIKVDFDLGSDDVIANVWITYTQEACPYGKASDYGTEAGSELKSNLTTEKNIATWTAAGLSILIGAFSVPAGIATGVAQALISTAQQGNITTKCLSFKRYKYYHSTYGYQINNTLKAIKNSTYWYVDKNYKTFAKHTIDYTVSLWG